MLFHQQPTDPWSRADFKLLEAYQVLQDERCGDCGRSVWLCHSEDPSIQWDIQTQVCYASKALQEWSERQSKKKKKTHGQQPVPVPYRLKFDEKGTPDKDFEDLPSREEFFKKE